MALPSTRAVESVYHKENQIRSWIATASVLALPPLIIATNAQVEILERWRIT